MKRILSCLTKSLFLVLIFKQSLAADYKKNAITAYYGLGTNAHIEEIPTFSFETRKANFAGIAFAREFYKNEKLMNISLEYEFGAYSHFGNFGSHQEATVTILARFNNLFPKKFFIESFAVGEGISLASENPRFEAHLHDDNDSNDLLNYLAFEFVFKLPKLEDTRFIYRLHHRSGVYGLFDGIHGGSNYLSFGIRQKF
jgi:hypothetical protein